jgi:carboxypeptidase Taq
VRKGLLGLFVLLEHDPGPAAPAGSVLHWDLLIRPPGAADFATWRLAADPTRTAAPVPAERIHDHPPRFWDFEGALRRAPGAVRRIDRGTSKIHARARDAWRVALYGERLRGEFAMSVNEQGRLHFRRAAFPPVAAPGDPHAPPAQPESTTVARQAYEQFIGQVREIGLAESVAEVLEWDQQTYMPPRAATPRADQLSYVAGLAHERMISDEFGTALDAAEREANDDPVVATNIREMRRLRDRKLRIPTALVQKIASTTVMAKKAWAQAREAADFSQFAPHLSEMITLKKELAEHVGYDTEPYDALIDEFEPGARANEIQQVFDETKPPLVELVAAIHDAPRQPATQLLERSCPIPDQKTFARAVVAAMGFDFEAGRIDDTTHPFCSGFSPLDVRLTTRYSETYLPMALFGLMHEAGHGLYEQGLLAEHAYTPMGASVSLGIHESQSRMWENLVGRSRPFWEHYLPALQQRFPALADVSLDDWYFAINTVRPSFIRVEADEVTYNLHIMLRFEIERRIFTGRHAVNDIPELWNDYCTRLLGITPPDDAQGCLQDIHWSMGVFGYFPTYALGNLYAAQFFTAAKAALPDLDDQVRRGELRPLREWLRDNIHAHGQRYRANELAEVVTGRGLTHEPFVAYLNEKYQPLYGL